MFFLSFRMNHQGLCVWKLKTNQKKRSDVRMTIWHSIQWFTLHLITSNFTSSFYYVRRGTKLFHEWKLFIRKLSTEANATVSRHTCLWPYCIYFWWPCALFQLAVSIFDLIGTISIYSGTLLRVDVSLFVIVDERSDSAYGFRMLPL